jgi:hypothetical protein
MNTTCPCDQSSISKQSASIYFYALLTVFVFFGFQLWLDAGWIRVLAGDDIRSFFETSKGLLAYHEMMTSFYKVRPIASIIMWLSTLVTDGHYEGLILICIAIHTINALILLKILHSVLHVGAFLSLAIALVLAFNRFTAYIICIELGLMEGAGITILLLFVWNSILLIQSPTKFRVLSSSFYFLMLLHIHERYIAMLAPCIVIAMLIWPKNHKAGYGMMAFSVLSLFINICIKKYCSIRPF